jgi:RIO kinase 1
MLLRDVANLGAFFGARAPELLDAAYGPEIWSLYKRGLLQPTTPLTGRFAAEQRPVDVDDVLRVVDDARAEEKARLLRLQVVP